MPKARVKPGWRTRTGPVVTVEVEDVSLEPGQWLHLWVGCLHGVDSEQLCLCRGATARLTKLVLAQRGAAGRPEGSGGLSGAATSGKPGGVLEILPAAHRIPWFSTSVSSLVCDLTDWALQWTNTFSSGEEWAKRRKRNHKRWFEYYSLPWGRTYKLAPRET